MYLPLIVGVAAAIAGAIGVGSAVHSGATIKRANETMKDAQQGMKEANERVEQQNRVTCREVDKLGTRELEIMDSFQKFSDIFEQIKNKPEFQEYVKDDVKIPKYDKEEIERVSIGAGVLMGGLSGATIGTAGGFAAVGATTAAVMALGTASTGTAIASLSGAAATNATLAALGGGAIAAGGGGIALGTTVLGAATLGVGLLVGGVIFNIAGGKLAAKADKCYDQMIEADLKADEICAYLRDLSGTSNQYLNELDKVDSVYQDHLSKLNHLVNDLNHTDWTEYSESEQLLVKNAALLVGLLYKMCSVKLVLQQENEEFNMINKSEVEEEISAAEICLDDFSADEAEGQRRNEAAQRNIDEL